MRASRGTLLVVALLVTGAALFGGGLVGFRAWLFHRPHRGGVRAVAISPDGTLVATASDDRTIKLWDADTLGLEPALVARATFFGHRKGVVSVAFVGSGERLVSASTDGTVRLWDVAGVKELHVHKTSETPKVVLPLGDGRSLLVSSNQPKVLDADAETEDSLKTRAFVVTSQGAGMGAQGGTCGAVERSWAAVGLENGDVALIDHVPGSSRLDLNRVWDAHARPVRALAFSSGGQRLLSGSDDGLAKLWDLATATLVRTFQGHAGPIVGAAIAPEGGRAITVSEDRTLRIWSITDGRELGRVELSEFLGTPTSLALSPDGRWVAVGMARPGNAEEHRLETGTVLRVELPGPH